MTLSVMLIGSNIFVGNASGSFVKTEPTSNEYSIETAIDSSEIDYDLREFSYLLKDTYNSYAEVVEEKKSLRDYSEQYYVYMLEFLSPIEAADGYEAAYKMEMNSGYYTKRIQLEEELERWESMFKPETEELRIAKENLLKDYVGLANQSEFDQNTESGKKAIAALNEYKNGDMSIDDALLYSGTIDFLKKLYESEYDHDLYREYLSQFNLSNWFSLSDYQ